MSLVTGQTRFDTINRFFFLSCLNLKKSTVPGPERLTVASQLSCYYFYHGKCLDYSWNDDVEAGGPSL